MGSIAQFGCLSVQSENCKYPINQCSLFLFAWPILNKNWRNRILFPEEEDTHRTQLKFYWTLVEIIKWIHCHHVRNQWTKTMHRYVCFNVVGSFSRRSTFISALKLETRLTFLRHSSKFRRHPHQIDKGTCTRPVWMPPPPLHDSEALSQTVRCAIFPCFHRQPRVAAVYEDIIL